MSAKAFIDTNVIVYLFDRRDPEKQRRAGDLLEKLAASDDPIVISTQVLQEAFVALTRKLGLGALDALQALELAKEAGFQIQNVDVPVIWRAGRRSLEDRLSFWDSLIIETALDAGCTTLYSEDLQRGRQFDSLAVSNPFA